MIKSKLWLIFVVIVIQVFLCKKIESFSINLEETLNINNQNLSKIWAVLVAGSNGYFNYRHQADVLHAYKILNKNHGIPKEQIVLMMYDDIAYNKYNPYKGNIINYPGGENLYTDDIEKDFVKEEVSPKNFLKVLLGNEKLKKSGKKVLQSNENDHVFIYFSDHGAPGLIGFPHDVLKATEMFKTLKKMKEKKRFNKLVFYLESCESGSMFDGLLDNSFDIYAVTAANQTESSYAVFEDKKRSTFLADEFSINWMIDAEKNDQVKKDELLSKQFENVQKQTKQSNVCRFGDLSIASQNYLSDFIGKPIFNLSYTENISGILNENTKKINSRDVEYMLTKIHSFKNNDNKFLLLKKNRNIIKKLMNQLMHKISLMLKVNSIFLTTKEKIENRECYEKFVDEFTKNCVNISEHTYLFRYLNLFVNTCNIIKKNKEKNILTVDENELKKEMKNICQFDKKTFFKIPKIV